MAFPYVACWALLARGNLLSVLSVYQTEPNTDEAFGELLRLTPIAAEALRAV